MKISNKQLMMLFQIAISTGNIANNIGFDQETRHKLVNEILTQQDTELKDLDCVE